jgi:hypothetical protein
MFAGGFVLLAVLTVMASTQPMSIMMTVGCVESDGRGGFTLTRATEPEAMTDRLPEQPSADAPLGTVTLRMVGTLDEFGVASHEGHKVWAKGLLNPGEPNKLLNLTSITHLAPSCE